MPKFHVEVPYLVWTTVEVEADDDEDAIEKALDETCLGGYQGNGGTHRLIGPQGKATIEVPDQHFDGDRIDIYVEQL